MSDPARRWSDGGGRTTRRQGVARAAHRRGDQPGERAGWCNQPRAASLVRHHPVAGARAGHRQARAAGPQPGRRGDDRSAHGRGDAVGCCPRGWAAGPPRRSVRPHRRRPHRLHTGRGARQRPDACPCPLCTGTQGRTHAQVRPGRRHPHRHPASTSRCRRRARRPVGGVGQAGRPAADHGGPAAPDDGRTHRRLVAGGAPRQAAHVPPRHGPRPARRRALRQRGRVRRGVSPTGSAEAHAPGGPSRKGRHVLPRRRVGGVGCRRRDRRHPALLGVPCRRRRLAPERHHAGRRPRATAPAARPAGGSRRLLRTDRAGAP